jgi:hypothetical protein
MKLWHLIQWGNKDEGANGKDTQCVVSASTMEEAIEYGSSLLRDVFAWKDGQLDHVILLGYDEIPDGQPICVIGGWIEHGWSMRTEYQHQRWFRHPENNQWLTQQEMYGDDK